LGRTTHWVGVYETIAIVRLLWGILFLEFIGQEYSDKDNNENEK